MDVIKNIASGKYFIFIEDSGNDEALVVTPQGELKSLQIELFDEPESRDEEELVAKGLIMPEQVERFRRYGRDRSEECMERAQRMIRRLSSEQKQALLEELRRECQWPG